MQSPVKELCSPEGALRGMKKQKIIQRYGSGLVTLLFLVTGFLAVSAQELEMEYEIPISQRMVSLLMQTPEKLAESTDYLDKRWQSSWTPMLVEVLYLSGNEERTQVLQDLLRKKTGQGFDYNLNDWMLWWWTQDPATDPDYADFKAFLYGLIDWRFSGYFDNNRANRIRLDEVVWGGVHQDGIPPLRQPKMIAASAADYLEDDNVIFGIALNDDVRAYPKRILAWHEMFIDEIGGTEYAGVYCTLCGAVILYETHFNGVRHQLGTSGFLYRSNKLMYDKDTQSLWNTTWGEPVIGPLVGQGIKLKRSHLVTTTWGEWRRRHPDTKVLSLDTGYERDYSEGAAYRDYFATDELMFEISTSDERLKNKDEVLALTYPQVTTETMAISVKVLEQSPVYENSLGTQDFVVLTDTSGANRVYEKGEIEFLEYDRDSTLTDSQGNTWTLYEDRLEYEGKTLTRLPAHRAFWFGWHAAYPDTILIR